MCRYRTERVTILSDGIGLDKLWRDWNTGSNWSRMMSPGNVLLRTQGHLRKIRPDTRLGEWPELVGRDRGEEPQDGLQDVVQVLIPGAVGPHRVLHPRAEGGDRLQESESLGFLGTQDLKYNFL